MRRQRIAADGRTAASRGPASGSDAVAGGAGTRSGEALRMEPSEAGAGDRELMARLAAGDRDALAPLVERHYTRLYRIALAYLRQPEDALDVVQEAFVKAYKCAPRWDGSAEAGPWLTRVTVNLAIDRWRRNRRRGETFAPLAEATTRRRSPTRSPRPTARVARARGRRARGAGAARRCPSGSARSSCCATTRT